MQAPKTDERGLPETFSKRMLFDQRWFYIIIFVVLQLVVYCCSCMLGIVKCACGFGAEMLYAVVLGMIQNYMFNMDPGTFCYLVPFLQPLTEATS